jgi:predicted ATPase
VLIDNLLGRSVADEVKERIARAAEGNPLFVEELVAMLIDAGAIRQDDGSWIATGDLSSLAVPPTIQALLDARLDRLGAGERGILERAAVAGRIFSRSAVRVLSPPAEHAGLDERLAGLVRKQLVRPHRAEFGRENTYRFRHSLIRDAAYRQMSKAARAELHERFAGWLESAGETLSPEQEEIIGYHLEQAHRFRSALGSSADDARALARRAAERFTSAGRQALTRGDSSSAVGLLTRAALLLRDDGEADLATSLDLGAALWWNSEFERAASVLDRAREQAARNGDRVGAARALVDRARVAIDAKEAGALERGAGDADAALRVFEEARDDSGLARVWALLAKIEHQRCCYARAAQRLERALLHASRGREARDIEGLLTHFQYVLLFGPTPVPEAIERCLEMAKDARFEPSKRFAAARAAILAYLHAMQGRFDEARALCETSKSLFRDLGLSVFLAGTHWYSASVELLAGNAAEAERDIRAALEHGDTEMIHSQFPERSALLAETVLEQGRASEALRHTETSERFASPDDVFTQVSWRRVRARAFALEGRMDEAQALAARAVEVAAATDSLGLRGDALIALADVRRRRGEAAESEHAAEEAAALFERKGNVVALEKARAFVSDLARAGP